MTDREQIIEDFEHAVNKARGDYYDYVDLTVEDADKILELLKYQEAEQPIVHENSYGWKFYYCPKCKQEFYQNRKQAYCDKCGKAVKWK